MAKQSYEKAFYWFSAEQEDAQAFNNVFSWQRFEQSYEKAFYWFKKSAEQEDVQKI